jgi:hypothetical protein
MMGYKVAESRKGESSASTSLVTMQKAEKEKPLSSPVRLVAKLNQNTLPYYLIKILINKRICKTLSLFFPSL